MSADSRPPVQGLYVAGQGDGPGDGLHRFVNRGGRWRGEQLAAAPGLAALARHPSLPVVYAVAGTGEGTLYAWDVSGEAARVLSEQPTGGLEPAHLAVDPSGRMLVVANYSSSTLALWPLAPNGSLAGSLVGEATVVPLSGSSVDPDRQLIAHPHQVVFNRAELYVVDLGADVVRTFAVSPPALTSLGTSAVPPGTGPRHLIVLPGGDVVISGELASSILVGRPQPGSADWRTAPSTERAELAPGRDRNYPGDIRGSVDGRFAYLANRGNDTIATFSLETGTPRLLSELDSGVRWPQHLLVTGDDLVVAGRDSSAVVALSLVAGIPVGQRELFECARPVWLEPIRDN